MEKEKNISFLDKIKSLYCKVKTFLFGDGDCSIKKDWWIASLLTLGFFLLLKMVMWLSDKFGITEAFNLMDFYVVAAKAGFVSALVWSLIRFVFSGTLGKDFGKTFDDGWDKMEPSEKTRWVIGVFSVLFFSLIYAFSK